MTKVALLSYEILDCYSEGWNDGYLTVQLGATLDDSVEWFDVSDEDIKLLQEEVVRKNGKYNYGRMVLLVQGTQLAEDTSLKPTLPEVLEEVKKVKEKKRKAVEKRKATAAKRKATIAQKKAEEEKKLLEELKEKYEK